MPPPDSTTAAPSADTAPPAPAPAFWHAGPGLPAALRQVVESWPQLRELPQADAIADTLRAAPGARLFLVYETPVRHLARAMEGGHPPAEAAEAWARETETLLQLARAHRGTATLLEAGDLAGAPEAFAALSGLPAPDIPPSRPAADDPVLALLAAYILAGTQRLRGLAGELEASTRPLAGSTPAVDPGAAFAGYRTARQSADAAQARIAQLEGDLARAREQVGGERAAAEALKTEMAAVTQKHDEQVRARDADRQALEMARAEAEAARAATEQARAEAAGAKAALESARSEAEAAEAAAKTRLTEFRTETDEVRKALEARLARAEADAAEAQAMHEARLAEAEAEARRTREALEARLETAEAEAAQTLKALEARLAEQTRHAAALEEQNAKAQRAFSDLSGRFSRLRRSAAEHEREARAATELRRQAGTQQEQIDKLTGELVWARALAREEITQLKASFETMEAHATGLEKRLAEAETARASKAAEHAQVQQAFADLSARFARLGRNAAEHERAAEEVPGLRRKVETLTAELAQRTAIAREENAQLRASFAALDAYKETLEARLMAAARQAQELSAAREAGQAATARASALKTELEEMRARIFATAEREASRLGQALETERALHVETIRAQEAERKALEATRKRLAAAEAERDRRGAEIARLTGELEREQARVRDLLGSTSWRAMAPARRISRALTRG